MTLLEALVLGLIQGLTEFLPVSSSGHLALGSKLFGLTDPAANLAFNIAVHFGSLLAVAVYVRKEIKEMFTTHPRLMAVLAAATLPLVVVVLLTPAKEVVASLSTDMRAIGAYLLCTACVLYLVRGLSGRGDEEQLSFGRALFVGCAQVLAILPGISRSGMTLAAGLQSGLKTEQALRFAFLMSVPAIGGAFLLMLFDGALSGAVDVMPMAVGTACAFVTSLIAIKLMVGIVARRNLGWFALYCAVAGTIAVVSGA